MSTFCHGVAAAQSLDKSGEIVDIKGLDISSLASTGIVNYEHKSDIPGQICGKILTAKKIFNKENCSDSNELYFWNKTKNPFVYITAELLDDYCQSGKDAAGILKYDYDKKEQNKQAILGFSIEGSEIPNSRGSNKMVVSRGIARKTTLTSAPCNSQCVAELLIQAPKSQIKDDFEEIFKSAANAIEMFKSDEGLKIYEQHLAKKEKDIDFKKSESSGWSKGKVDKQNSSVHYSHPEHGIVSIQKQPSGDFHVKHNGTLAGVGGVKGSFSGAKEAGSHAKKYMQAVSQKKIFPNSAQNHPSPSMSLRTDLKKAVEAGSYNAAPSTLVNGAAYQSESLGSKPISTGAEDHVFHGTKKKDWNKQAKEDYDRWPHKEKFEKFMKARMPHLADGEIRAIGRTLSLKKNIDFEKSLKKLIKSEKKDK